MRITSDEIEYAKKLRELTGVVELLEKIQELEKEIERLEKVYNGYFDKNIGSDTCWVKFGSGKNIAFVFTDDSDSGWDNVNSVDNKIVYVTREQLAKVLLPLLDSKKYVLDNLKREFIGRDS